MAKQRDALLTWERQLSSVYRVNPFSDHTYNRLRRKAERELRALQPEQQHTTFEDRLQLAQLWLHRYASAGEEYPALWQSAYLCLARFVVDSSFEAPKETGNALQQTWFQLDQLGQQYKVPDNRALLGIAARARRANISLSRIRGHSRRLHDLKREIWSACFGADLLRLLLYGRIFQELNVLIIGPTGSGKELAAQVLLSAVEGEWKQEKNKKTLTWQPHRTEAINLAEFPRPLMAAQITGYKKGAFTGAASDFQGVLSRCDEGAVLLDEIGELPEEGQVVLLRALETKRVRPLGAEAIEAANCRVIAATHKQLNTQDAGLFRRDLFYRLAGAVIEVPSLAERPEDLLPIALGFLQEWGIRKSALRQLEDPRHHITEWLKKPEIQSYAWPGNARELKRAVSRILVGYQQQEFTQRLPSLFPQEDATVNSTPPRVPIELVEGTWSLEEAKQWYIEYVLELQQGNQKLAASQLGIHRTTIYNLNKRKKQNEAKDTQPNAEETDT